MSDLCVACCLWRPNEHTLPKSLCYDETWVDKLYRGFRRNLTRPFRFVVMSDRDRGFCDGVEVERLVTPTPDYGCLVEPFRIDGPLIICGLDMVVLDNLDHMADYCMTADEMALVRDPYNPDQGINPIVLVPKKRSFVWDNWRCENDMEWLRQRPHLFMDDMWPGQALSLKAHEVRRKGTQGAKIVYMHGEPKADKLMHLDWVREHWR